MLLEGIEKIHEITTGGREQLSPRADRRTSGRSRQRQDHQKRTRSKTPWTWRTPGGGDD